MSGCRAKLPTMPCSRRCGRSIRARASSTPTPRPKRASPLPSTTARPAFPPPGSTSDGDVRMRIVDGALQLRSDRARLRFLGDGAPALADEEGFVDTGDMVERRGDRLYFVGRRGGIINVGGAKVHPEEVEAALNAHAAVRASRVFARKNPITGALVVAEVVLRDGQAARSGFGARNPRRLPRALPAHMAPARLRFVADLPMTDGGKARAPWIMSSSPAPAAALASRSPNGLARDGFARRRGRPSRQRGVGSERRRTPAAGALVSPFRSRRRRGDPGLRARDCARGSGRSTGWSTTPAGHGGPARQRCATPTSRR